MSEFIKKNPSKELSSIIRTYWLLDKPDQGINDQFTIFPNGSIEIVIHMRGVLKRMVNGCYIDEEAAFVEGQRTSSINLLQVSDVRTFGITFYPWAFKKLFNISSEEFTNQIYSLKDVHLDLENLHNSLNKMHDFESLVRISNNYFKNLLNRSTHDLTKFEIYFTQLYCLNKFTNVHEELGISRRYSEMKFRELIGINRTVYQKKIRLIKAINLILQSSDESLTEIAYRCDYYDQSHFNSDVRQYLDVTPKFIAYNKEKYLKYFFESA